MANIVQPASWADVPLLETNTAVLGGEAGPMNFQAKALVARSEFLDDKIDALTATNIDYTPTGLVSSTDVQSAINEVALLAGMSTGTRTVEIQTATASQSVFTLTNPYLPGSNTLQVFVNGLLMSVGTDYTETSSTVLTFVVNLSLNDEVQFVVLGQNIATASAANVSYLPAGTGAVATTVQSKLRESVSVKDFGAAIDGVTDDSTAISNARNKVINGGAVVYGGKTNAAGFWENLSALAMEWIRGSAIAYAIDLSASKPLISLKLFNGTPSVGPGYAAYGSRFDAYTKTGVDVASTSSGMFGMQSYSTNSSGGNFNNTNQLALVANSSAMDVNSSASIEAINAIASTAYTGALPQNVVGVEADLYLSNRPAGWFGDASANYSTGYSAVLGGSSAGDGTAAFQCGTSSATTTWWHGAVLAANTKTGLTVARDGTRRPETGVWVSAATDYGIYVGSFSKHQLNPGSTASFTYKPTIGIALGHEGATSANSHKLRLISTDGASAQYSSDIYTATGGNINFAFAGTSKLQIASFDGSISIQGSKVVGTRDTGWGNNTGTTSKAAFDSASVTLQTLAQTVSALQQAMKNHGLIGA